MMLSIFSIDSLSPVFFIVNLMPKKNDNNELNDKFEQQI